MSTHLHGNLSTFVQPCGPFLKPPFANFHHFKVDKIFFLYIKVSVQDISKLKNHDTGDKG